MIYDISQELRDFTYITSVYKCIADYNLKGHQIGRKVGDMLEILTMGGIYKCPPLLERLDTEGKLEGFTTAGHKVEFGFYRDLRHKQGLFGAVECKCVGVEETTAGQGKKSLRRLNIGDSFSIDFKGRWMGAPITQTLRLIGADDDTATLELTDTSGRSSHTVTLSIGDNIKFTVDEHENLVHTMPHGNMLEEIPGLIRICKTVKFDGMVSHAFQFSLYNCLAGPQTIEKAKQASLVAMDLRKKIDGHWGKEEVPAEQKQMNFLHVICEFSHWEEKSRGVITTCIDHNIIVPDAVLIKAFAVFEATFGLSHMLKKISKNQYVKDPAVRAAIETIFSHFEDHIFYDIAMGSYIGFHYADGKLVVAPI